MKRIPPIPVPPVLLHQKATFREPRFSGLGLIYPPVGKKGGSRYPPALLFLLRGHGRDNHMSRTNLCRIILIVNFMFVLALVGPGSNRKLYLALKSAGVANLATLTIQVWFIGSTILATVLFAWAFAKKSDMGVVKHLRPTTLDWIILLAWWTVLVVLCLYAFMMGMGG